MKSKFVAAILALLLGMLGAHRFYLGQLMWGFVYLVAFIISVVLIMYGIGIFGLIGLSIIVLIDFFILLTMKDETFNAKYNKNIPNE